MISQRSLWIFQYSENINISLHIAEQKYLHTNIDIRQHVYIVVSVQDFWLRLWRLGYLHEPLALCNETHQHHLTVEPNT